MIPDINQTKACCNLLAAIIDGAVDDFNHGDHARQKNAGSFFRNDANWMCAMVGATPKDIIRCRLKGDPFNMVVKKHIPKRRFDLAETITFNGDTLTIAEWSAKTGLNIATLRSRINKYGICAETFAPSRMAGGVKKITFKGETKTISHWAREYGIKIDTLRSRIKRWGMCDEILQEVMPEMPQKTTGRKAKELTYNGETRTMAGWAKFLDITPPAMHNRYRAYGMSDKTFSPLRRSKNSY